MSKNIEVELTGALTEEQNERLIDFFTKNGEVGDAKHRVLIDYSTFIGDGLENREKDIRIRITNGKPEIIIKLGLWNSSSHRKELSVFTEEESFDRLVQIFAALGYEKGMLCERTKRDFTYKGINFSLVEILSHSYHFEAKVATEEDNIEATKKHIEKVCEELGLTIYTDKEYFDYIAELNTTANEVFDFKNYTENYFEDRFHFSQEKAAQ